MAICVTNIGKRCVDAHTRFRSPVRCQCVVCDKPRCQWRCEWNNQRCISLKVTIKRHEIRTYSICSIRTAFMCSFRRSKKENKKLLHNQSPPHLAIFLTSRVDRSRRFRFNGRTLFNGWFGRTMGVIWSGWSDMLSVYNLCRALEHLCLAGHN